MITLYHSKDTRSLRCLWLLEELGLEHQVHLVEYPPSIKQPQYLDVNPSGTLPFLIDGDTRLRESCAILLYLANRYGNGACSVEVDSPHYGGLLDWTFYGEAALTVALSVAFRYAVVLPKPQRVPAVAEDYRSLMIERLGVIDGGLASSFLCADKFTVADISVGYGLLLGEMMGLAGYYPQRVADYLNRLKQRPAFIKARAFAG